MRHAEEIWLNSCTSDSKLVYYFRNADDTLLLLKSKEHINKFLRVSKQTPKPTYTDLTSSFDSYVPTKYNDNLISLVCTYSL